MYVKWILKGFQEPGSEVATNQDDKRCGEKYVVHLIKSRKSRVRALTGNAGPVIPREGKGDD